MLLVACSYFLNTSDQENFAGSYSKVLEYLFPTKFGYVRIPWSGSEFHIKQTTIKA